MKGIFCGFQKAQDRKLRKQHTGHEFEDGLANVIAWPVKSWFNAMVAALFLSAGVLLVLRIVEVADRLDTTFGGALKWVCMGNY